MSREEIPVTLAKRIITPGGEDLVLLPLAEYERLVEAAEDLADVAAYDEAMRKLAAGEDEMVPAAIALRLLGDEHPVRVWREHRGLSVKDLADAALISPSYLSQIETGRREGTLETMARIARVPSRRPERHAGDDGAHRPRPAHRPRRSRPAGARRHHRRRQRLRPIILKVRP